MARIQGYTEDDVDLLVADFAKVVEASLERAARAAAANLRPAVTAASSAGVGPDDIAVVTTAWESELDGVLMPYVAEVYTGSATSVAVGLADAFPNELLPGIPLITDEYAETYMKTVTNRLVGVGDELWEDVRNELLDGLQQGQSIEQLADRIIHVADFTKQRATVIARTEIHGAAEAGSISQLRFVGYADNEVTKEWVDVGDARVRPTHAHANKQRVLINEKFIVGGWSLDFPGDPSAPPDETIQCRCTSIFDVTPAPQFRCQGILVAATAPSTHPSATTCVCPMKVPDISHLQYTPPGQKIPLAALIHNRFIASKISPAFGGSKIHQTLQTTRAAIDAELPGVLDAVSDWDMLAAVDQYYVAKKDTFFDKYVSWHQSPAGQKVVGKSPTFSPLPKAATVPIDLSPTPPVPTPSTSKLLSAPSQNYFKILDDPGPSGDGEVFPGGPWGKYGASGVLVRAIDGQGVPRFLLIQRGEKYIGSQKFKWQLPGGGADKFEGPYEAAARELWEETAPTKEYVESMVPLGEYVFHGPGGWKYTNIVAHADHTFAPSVHGSTGDAKWFTLKELQMMLDDNQIVKELAPTLEQLAKEADDLAKVTPQSVPTPPSSLPAVAAKPNPGDIIFTGQTLGSHGAQVWKNTSTGAKWLFKPQDKFLTDLDVATARIQSKALQTRPGVYPISLNGQHGSIQYMFENSHEAWPHGSFDPLKLSPADIAVMQREQIFDWMISNFDTHSGQWIRLEDGTLFETDKGQAFKFFGKDKLDWNYVPVYPLGQDKLTYSPLWKAFVKGQDIKLTDPTVGPLGEYVDQLMAIDDDTYRKLLEPYAFAAQKKFGVDAKALLSNAVARKNDLKKDFGNFWERAVAERQKVLPPPKPVFTAPTPPELPKPTIAPPTPTQVIATPGATGDISMLDYFAKQDILDEWVKLAGGKKVTPAWGGAKIYKQLQELKATANAGLIKAGITDFKYNDLQLLRVLDDAGGFIGKPKTYESVVVDWLGSPQSTVTVLKYGKLDASLNPAAAIEVPVKPVLPPAALVPDEATEVLATGTKMTPSGLFVDLENYQAGSVIGYAKTASGDILRATKLPGQTPAVAVQIFKNGKWKHDMTFTDWSKISIEYDYAGGTATWAIKPPTLKSQTTIAKIFGKTPGDSLTSEEIMRSKNLWKDGEVAATSVSNNIAYRLRSKGNGSFVVEFRQFGENWVIVHEHVDSLEVLNAIYTKPNWKATEDIFISHKSSVISGKNAGDVVSNYEMWTAALSKPNDPVAYVFEPSTQHTYRFKFDAKTGKHTLEMRLSGEKSWHYITTYDTGEQFKQASELYHYKWLAANADGTMPDALKTVAGKTSPLPGKVATKMSGYYDGDEIVTSAIPGYADQFNDYEVIALGKTESIYEWRVYSINGVYVREIRVMPNGGWSYDGIVNDLYQPIPNATNTKWYASTAHVTPSSVGAKDAKKAVMAKASTATKKAAKAAKITPSGPPPPPSAPPPPPKIGLKGAWPDKSAGDIVGPYDIWDKYGLYDEGQIIAYGKNKWTGNVEYRIFVANGKLITQKKSASGSWISTKVITQKYYVPAVNWNVTEDVLESAKLKTVQKNVAKKHPDAVLKTTAQKIGPQPIATPSPAAPFVMRHVDITPWNETEREEIYQYFRSSGTYTSASPETIWGKLQATKSFFQTKYKGKYLNLNEIEILRMIDEHRALKKNIVNTHPYEAKIVNWLKTPAGKSWVNKKIDAPIAAHKVPFAMEDFAAGGPLETQDYAAVTRAQSLKNRQDSHAKYGGWKPGEQQALKQYTGGVYSSWNRAIRTGDLGSYENSIAKAQRGMRPSVRPMLLHRKTTFAELNDPSISSYESLLPYVGRTYINRGFNSTSYTSTSWSGNLHIEIEAPTGTPMSHAQDYSSFKSEEEVTLATHLIYQIISVKQAHGKTVMRVRVIGQAGK